MGKRKGCKCKKATSKRVKTRIRKSGGTVKKLVANSASTKEHITSDRGVQTFNLDAVAAAGGNPAQPRRVRLSGLLR